MGVRNQHLFIKLSRGHQLEAGGLSSCAPHQRPRPRGYKLGGLPAAARRPALCTCSSVVRDALPRSHLG